MGTAAVKAGRAFVEITTENSALQKGLKNAQAQLRAFGSACTAVGRELLTVSAAMAAPIALSVRTFAAFDDQMRQVKAVTNAIGKEFEALTEQAKKLGRETSFTASQVAGGMASLGRMGFNPAEIEAAIPAMMNLSRATGTDLAESSQIAANNLRVFKMEAAQMPNVADMLTATANGSAQTLTDLGEALKMAGPKAAEAGQSLKETCIQLGILANMGIRGSMAGTALSRSFQQMASADVQKVLKSYGIEATTATGALRPMRDVLTDLAKATANLPNAEKIALFQKVFDIRGSLGGGILTSNITAIESMTKTLDDCAGLAEKTAKEMDSGLGGAFRDLASAAEGVGICIGDILQSALIPLTKYISSTLLALREWLAVHPAIAKALAGTVAAVATFGAALIAAELTAKGFAAVLTITQTAIHATQAAFAFFAASNPLGWALLATTAVIGLAMAINSLGRETRQTSDTMGAVLEKNNAARKLDAQRADRLAELAKKQQLSNAETAEAKNILAELEGKYGKFGAELDGVAGKLTLAAEAQAKLNEAMRNQAIADIDKKIAEHRQNIDIAQGYNDDMSGYWTNVGDIASLWGGGNVGRIEHNGRYMSGQWNEIAKLQAQKRALQPAKPEAKPTLKTTMDATQPDGAYLNPDDRIAAEKAVAVYQSKLQRERRSNLQNEIADIQAAANIQQRRADRAESKAVDDAMKADSSAGESMIAGIIAKYQNEAAAWQQYQNALTEAQGKEMTPERKAGLDTAFDAYQRANGMVDQYQQRLEQVQTATQKGVGTQSMGSFSAEALGAMIGGTGSAAEASLKEQQETNKIFKRLKSGSGTTLTF